MFYSCRGRRSSRQAVRYSEGMGTDQKDRYIQYLVDRANALDLDKRAMELAVEEFQGLHNNVVASLEELKQSVAALRSEVQEERNKRKAAEARVRKLDQQLKYAQKNRFGDKRQKACKDDETDEVANREDEKEGTQQHAPLPE